MLCIVTVTKNDHQNYEKIICAGFGKVLITCQMCAKKYLRKKVSL